MKALSDYIFSPPGSREHQKPRPNERYRVLAELDDLREGQVVTFVGYADVDNHDGIFVFTDAQQGILEVRGDFCAAGSTAALKNALIET